MSTTPPIFTTDDVRAAVSADDALASARTAFLALHHGTGTVDWCLTTQE